ncbi:right-handed parallel beta-helix repeat-containing protein [Halostella sp. JP-L12]|uniref:right-handed parallel beta-helix repeat-containing protein n=1 Tax=Halostella TaxID=1843185 RepID=UPI000EF7DF85|nr:MULTISPECIES: right-handed parallel beta-helix repeat-containing protein [Halostella]NHN49858.1 right-handed parallel beta-helix repeat-containing protein [Halostella sp. JP-L12]
MDESGDSPSVDRRRFLKALGATAATGALAACSRRQDSPDEEDQERTVAGEISEYAESGADSRTFLDQFENIVDVAAVAESDGGLTPFDPVVEEHGVDSTLFIFGDGRYELEEMHFTDVERVGMIAADGAEPAIVPGGEVRSDTDWVSLIDADHVYIDGLRLDFRDDGTGGEITIAGSGDITVRNVSAIGRFNADNHSVFQIETYDGRAVLESVELRGDPDSEASVSGVYVGRNHSGVITIENCVFEDFSNNGIYASDPGRSDGAGGVVHVDDCLLRNNNVASVRLGGPGSSVRNTRIEVPRAPPTHGTGMNARGIRLRTGHDHVVENCTLVFGSDAGFSYGAIKFHPESGGATIRDTDVRMDADYPAINTEPPAGDRDGSVTVENVTITGAANGGRAVDVVGRPGSVIRQSCIHQTGDHRNGIVFTDADNCQVANTTITVSRDAIVTHNSSVEVENVERGPTCGE